MSASKAVVAIKKVIKHGDAATCREMFDDARSRSDITPEDVQLLFGAAAEKGSPVVCEIFLRAGADINALDRNGRTALQVAVDDRSVTFTRFLLKKGALPNVPNARGQTPLHVVHMEAGIVQNPKELTLCSVLLENGANPNAVCSDFRTPLHNAVLDQNPGTARLLVAGGASPSFVPDSPPHGYFTPFQMAVDLGNPVMARFFLRECEVDVNEKTLCGRNLTQLTRNRLIKSDILATRAQLKVEAALGAQVACDEAPTRSREGLVL
jgi:ankyrin repeat protein